MATESGARQIDFQNVSVLPTLKNERNSQVKIYKFNEEVDLRSGILLDIHYDMLAYFVNNGFPWREETLLKKVFQNVVNEVQGQLLLSISRSMSVVATGVMC